MKGVIVTNCDFNKSHYPDLIGRTFTKDNVPSYVKVLDIELSDTKCKKCTSYIPKARLKMIPEAKLCSACSTTAKISGFMSWEHKTTPVLNLCSAETAKEINRVGYRKGTGVIQGIRMSGH